MRDNIMSDITKIATESLQYIDKVNKRLIMVIIILSALFCTTIAAMTGLYFLSDYQYPQITQEASQQSDTVKTELKQQVKGGDD